MKEGILQVCNHFIGSESVTIEHLGDGHINDTYLIRTGNNRYVCQRIHNEMNITRVENNYMSYREACKAAQWIYPVWMKNRDGKYFDADQEGGYWRMYPYLTGDIPGFPMTKELLFACGQGLSTMHGILQEMEIKPQAVYPQLHDLEYYYDCYRKTLTEGDIDTDSRDQDMEKEFERGIGFYTELMLDRSKVVHGDTKVANILFRDGKVAGFLDLDTIMVGSVSEDIADCIRSCCIREGRLDEESMKYLLDGYMRVENGLITDCEVSIVTKVLGKLCFELALRYYTDAISRKRYFSEKYPGYRLEKARYNLALSRRR